MRGLELDEHRGTGEQDISIGIGSLRGKDEGREEKIVGEKEAQ